MPLARRITRWLAGLATLLIGGGFTMACYGPVVPAADPSVELVDFTYQPVAVTAGDTLVFNATLNKAAYGCNVRGLVGSAAMPLAGVEPGWLDCTLNDFGYPPDAVAMDGIWAGELTLPADLPAQSGVPVSASLEWRDGSTTGTLAAPPMEILAKEEQ